MTAKQAYVEPFVLVADSCISVPYRGKTRPVFGKGNVDSRMDLREIISRYYLP